jgi:hypothetical protein
MRRRQLRGRRAGLSAMRADGDALAMPGQPMLRCWLALAVFAGCANKTGFLLEVGTSHNSVEKGIAKLELVMAQMSWCERWVEDKGASHTIVDVSGRDLSQSPYTFLIQPVQATDIHAEVFPLVLARRADGQLIGEASYGAIPWAVGEVRRYRAAVELLARGSSPDGPRYVDDGGCVCLPGQPWIGNGSGSGCDANVITSFDRLQDTKKCELPANSSGLPRACDGQEYPGETVDRQLPCFADVNGTCRVGSRNCHDKGGYAYDHECAPADTDPALPDKTLCDAYLLCERNVCGDIIGCFTQALPAENHGCVLRIALTNDGIMHPCADGDWVTTISTSLDACPATLLEGVQQSPFVIGFRNGGEAQPVGACPLVLGVDKIDASSYDDVPYFIELWATLKDKLLKIRVDVVIGCENGVPSLVCQ